MYRKYMKSTQKQIDDRFGDIFPFRNQLRVSHWQVAQLSFELFLSDGSESGLDGLPMHRDPCIGSCSNTQARTRACVRIMDIFNMAARRGSVNGHSLLKFDP